MDVAVTHAQSTLCVSIAQFLLAPVLASESFVVLLLANTLYSLGWGFYTYITFLGYMGACLFSTYHASCALLDLTPRSIHRVLPST